MRPTLDEALAMRLQAARDEGWLELVVPPQAAYTSVGVDDLAHVIKHAIADAFGWILAEGFTALLVELFRIRTVEKTEETATHAELLKCIEDAIGVARYIDEGVSA